MNLLEKFMHLAIKNPVQSIVKQLVKKDILAN